MRGCKSTSRRALEAQSPTHAVGGHGVKLHDSGVLTRGRNVVGSSRPDAPALELRSKWWGGTPPWAEFCRSHVGGGLALDAREGPGGTRRGDRGKRLAREAFNLSSPTDALNTRAEGMLSLASCFRPRTSGS